MVSRAAVSAFVGSGIWPGGINREVLQQQVDVAAINREQLVADCKGIVFDGQYGAVDGIDQQDAVVYVCREPQAGNEIRRQGETVVGVVQAVDIGHADFVEVQVGLGLGHAVEPGLDGQRIEVE